MSIQYGKLYVTVPFWRKRQAAPRAETPLDPTPDREASPALSTTETNTTHSAPETL